MLVGWAILSFRINEFDNNEAQALNIDYERNEKAIFKSSTLQRLWWSEGSQLRSMSLALWCDSTAGNIVNRSWLPRLPKLVRAHHVTVSFFILVPLY
jgi:hypothetical protein